MKYLSVCSGIEAATVAWHQLGWQPAAFSEIEPFPSAVLAHHYPTVPNVGDMTKYKEWNLDSTGIDLLVGGTPCQSFSVAGLRKGLDDPRGNLALVYCGMLDHFRPRWFVWENVPGVLSSNGGRDFGAFLGALAELGYGFAYRVLDAQYFGVAQRRRRVFVVGHLGDWRAPAAVLFERESLRRDTAPSREAGKEVAGTLVGGASQGGMGPAGRTDCVAQGYVQPVAARMVAFGEYVDDGTASAMKARDYKDATDLVAQPIAFNARQDPDSWENRTGPLDTDGGTQAVAHPFTFDSAQITSKTNRSKAEPGIPCSTLLKDSQLHVVQPIDCREVSPTLTAKMQGSSGWAPYNESEHLVPMTSMAVRRLTPVECERLQGFPDNYTNIPWRKATESPDGPRYKALGNSMAVPVMQWIGQRVAAVDLITTE